MQLTYDQQQLIAIYNQGTRQGTIDQLQDMRKYLTAEEKDLRQLTDEAIALLRGMDDAAFEILDLTPDFEE